MSSQLAIGLAFRTGDVVVVDENTARYWEIVVVRRDGRALLCAWPRAIRKRGGEWRVEIKRLRLHRGASNLEHLRAVEHAVDARTDYETEERQAIDAVAARLARPASTWATEASSDNPAKSCKVKG